jgi:hypothetical protein
MTVWKEGSSTAIAGLPIAMIAKATNSPNCLKLIATDISRGIHPTRSKWLLGSQVATAFTNPPTLAVEADDAVLSLAICDLMLEGWPL